MKYWPGNTVNFKYPATGSAIVLAARDTTILPGIGQPQTMFQEVQVLKVNGDVLWLPVDTFI